MLGCNVVILGAGRPLSGDEHTGLRGAGENNRVLDWILEAVRNLDPVLYFVCGYRAEKVKQRYPELHFIQNVEWQDSKAGWSLLLAAKEIGNNGIICSYSDIVFREDIIKKFSDNQEADVLVAVDKTWRTRYAGRAMEDFERSEKVCLNDSLISRLGSDIPSVFSNAEFIGLAYFSPHAISSLLELASKPGNVKLLKRCGVSELIELLRLQGVSSTAIDVGAGWAQLNEPADLARFVLGTKAQTLHRLRSMVRRSLIVGQFCFTVSRWEREKLELINLIQEQFRAERLIVRSSALNEDSFKGSNAGTHKSILNVNGFDRSEIEKAIEDVISSYTDKSTNNEIFVQPMLTRVIASGVVLTRSLRGGAPYYVDNYTEGADTATVTDGSSREHKTLVMRRDVDDQIATIPPFLRGLLPAVREIENLLSYSYLDIEFAVTDSLALYVLQVRPIAAPHLKGDAGESITFTFLDNAIAKFNEIAKSALHILGDKPLFGSMPDWNPAEIIGTKPSVLATTIYRDLIMDDIWALQRAEYGYRDVRPQPLLVSFAGHPYIDVRASLNSFISADLCETTASRLVNFALDRLRESPEFHDKIEFDVIPTCFDLDFDRWEKHFYDYNFSQSEIKEIRTALRQITLRALKRDHDYISAFKVLSHRFDQIMSGNQTGLQRALLLLQDAKRYGTLTFAHFARSGFIAVSLLRSALTKQIISQCEYDDFFLTLNTVSRRLALDARSCANGVISWNDFVSMYGHLRPGTYDIVSPSYRSDPERYLRPIVDRFSSQCRTEKIPSHPPVGMLWQEALPKLSQAMARIDMEVSATELESFMCKAIEGREYGKFMFTKNVSLALDTLGEWGAENGLDVNLLSMLDISELTTLHLGSRPLSNQGDWLKALAEKSYAMHQHIFNIELPPMISCVEDFSAFIYPATIANFVGGLAVSAPSCEFNAREQDIDIKGKIILVVNADPGYDWVLNCGIAGLVTMYGGVNSHMAIRVAESGLPAAIGVGELRFRELCAAREIELDPVGRLLRVIN